MIYCAELCDFSHNSLYIFTNDNEFLQTCFILSKTALKLSVNIIVGLHKKKIVIHNNIETSIIL